MKIQSLAVLAIVIILPMSIILNSYSANQIKTLDLQISYDTRLLNSTYDGIKAFQLNMSNSTTSNILDSKMRDIKASIKTFYKSLASNFSMSGYGEEALRNYVPAVVYTLYDGYYIYSDYINTLDKDDKFNDKATYKDTEELYGLKPYIYYSCRYKRDGAFDVVITYSLDSYITIQGTIGEENVNEAGYLLSGVQVNGNSIKYRGIDIPSEYNKEGLIQNVCYQEVDRGESISDSTDRKIIARKEEIRESKSPYKKINGVKYYYNTEKKEIYSLLNNEYIPNENNSPELISDNYSARMFYQKADDFKKNDKVKKLKDLKLSTYDAIDAHGIYYRDYESGTSPYSGTNSRDSAIEIFGELENTNNNFIEDENSKFNMHRKEVIKNSIESNLIVAIANYNKVSTSDVKFAMPRLKDEEWEELTTNISMITFLQGLNIGGKVYSGYAMVPNDVNEDFVSKDSIYITLNGTYYRVTDEELTAFSVEKIENSTGVMNTDFERRTIQVGYVKNPDDMMNMEYLPRTDKGSYTSIIELNSNNGMKEILEAHDIKSATSDIVKIKLAEIYYTALGRERYGMYRVNNPFQTKLIQ